MGWLDWLLIQFTLPCPFLVHESTTTGTTSGAGTAYPSGALEFTPDSCCSVSEWVSEWVCVCEWVSEWVSVCEWVSEWVSEWVLLNANSAIFQLYHGENKVHFVLDQHAELDFFLVLAHWNNSPRVNMSFHSGTLFWFRANQFLLFLLNAACLARSNTYQFYSLWFNPTGDRTHDLPHSRRSW